MEKGKSAPTGCFKCGRPGHWSRDCPSSNAAASDANPNPLPRNPQTSFDRSAPAKAKPKKATTPRARPKLTPQLLLSDDGLGYILRHFPRNFKFRGRGREVSDLGNLISMYVEWHSRLLPYYSFHQFVSKVEQVAATKRVKLCLRELRVRVAKGGDPTKLHEPPAEDENPPDGQEGRTFEEDGINREGSSSKDLNAETVQEAMLRDVFDNAVEDDEVRKGREEEITEQQRLRMEANRLKALEKAAARRLAALEK